LFKRTLILLVCLFSLAGFITQAAADDDGDGFEPILNKAGVPIGRFSSSFDGVELKSRAVWLNDFRYELKSGYKVLDQRARRINISSIPIGQQVEVVVKDNSRNAMIPFLVELRYKK